MKNINSLKYYFPILYPRFYKGKNTKGEELIFLKCNENEEEDTVVGFDSNTQCEALENHFHLFDKVKHSARQDAKTLSLKITQNLREALYKQFPDKKFVIYLDLNYEDSIIIRFHQIWDNEPFYYSEEDFKEEYDKGRIILFRLID